MVSPSPETRVPDEPSADLRAAWTLAPDVHFLNHGSFGACPAAVLAHQAELRARMEREPVRFLARELEARSDETRDRLAAFVGADPEDLVPVPNATTGVNAVLRSLSFEPGDEILVTDHGYNACRNAVERVAGLTGARAVVVHLPFPIASPTEVLEAVLSAVTPRTRLCLIDHVTSPTGLVLPVADVVRELRERGVETLVDGAHAPGMLRLDLNALGAGYFTGNCHKWVCAPKGAALLHVRRDLQKGIRPAVISHGANSPRTDRSRYQLEFTWCGTIDPTAWLSVPEALRVVGGLVPGGWAEVRRRNHALCLHGRELLCQALDVAPPAPAEMLGSLATVPLPPSPDAGGAPRDAFAVDPLQTALFEEDRIEVPIMSWPAPGRRVLRISAQLYVRPASLRHLADALARRLG